MHTHANFDCGPTAYGRQLCARVFTPCNSHRSTACANGKSGGTITREQVCQLLSPTTVKRSSQPAHVDGSAHEWQRRVPLGLGSAHGIPWRAPVDFGQLTSRSFADSDNCAVCHPVAAISFGPDTRGRGRPLLHTENTYVIRLTRAESSSRSECLLESASRRDGAHSLESFGLPGCVHTAGPHSRQEQNCSTPPHDEKRT